ncbi:MAG: iron-only hydrogenase system regulator [Ruminococcus sp.]|nr:iron-only hydrogenase system regulator [Ruminococcus sp.]
MSKRVAVMSIIVENNDAVEKLNSVLHEASEFIIGRMGIPYREKGVSVISVVIDAKQDFISALTGKIGNIDGATVKTAYSNVLSDE